MGPPRKRKDKIKSVSKAGGIHHNKKQSASCIKSHNKTTKEPSLETGENSTTRARRGCQPPSRVDAPLPANGGRGMPVYSDDDEIIKVPLVSFEEADLYPQDGEEEGGAKMDDFDRFTKDVTYDQGGPEDFAECIARKSCPSQNHYHHVLRLKAYARRMREKIAREKAAAAKATGTKKEKKEGDDISKRFFLCAHEASKCAEFECHFHRSLHRHDASEMRVEAVDGSTPESLAKSAEELNAIRRRLQHAEGKCPLSCVACTTPAREFEAENKWEDDSVPEEDPIFGFTRDGYDEYEPVFKGPLPLRRAPSVYFQPPLFAPNGDAQGRGCARLADESENLRLSPVRANRRELRVNEPEILSNPAGEATLPGDREEKERAPVSNNQPEQKYPQGSGNLFEATFDEVEVAIEIGSTARRPGVLHVKGTIAPYLAPGPEQPPPPPPNQPEILETYRRTVIIFMDNRVITGASERLWDRFKEGLKDIAAATPFADRRLIEYVNSSVGPTACEVTVESLKGQMDFKWFWQELGQASDATARVEFFSKSFTHIRRAVIDDRLLKSILCSADMMTRGFSFVEEKAPGVFVMNRVTYMAALRLLCNECTALQEDPGSEIVMDTLNHAMNQLLLKGMRLLAMIPTCASITTVRDRNAASGTVIIEGGGKHGSTNPPVPFQLGEPSTPKSPEGLPFASPL